MGSCNLSKKKNVANELRPSVFASVPQSFFLVAASKTDVTSKTEYIKIKTDYHSVTRHRCTLNTPKPHRFCNLGLWGCLRSQKLNPLKPRAKNSLIDSPHPYKLHSNAFHKKIFSKINHFFRINDTCGHVVCNFIFLKKPLNSLSSIHLQKCAVMWQKPKGPGLFGVSFIYRSYMLKYRVL